MTTKVPEISFNSLQAGRGIQRLCVYKLYINKTRSFNSLQAGRGIQSLLVVLVFGLFGCDRFNSLQAGRGIQSGSPSGNFPPIPVSIPFKREGAFKGKCCCCR